MTDKKIKSLRARILKASKSLSVMGDMMLCFEIDAMTKEERLQLQAALLSSPKPISYRYLDKKVAS